MDHEMTQDDPGIWRGAIETRLANLEHGQSAVQERLGIIEHDQRAYMASVAAIREYFDGTLRCLRDEMGSGFNRLTRIVELHAQRIDSHDAFKRQTSAGMIILYILQPLAYLLLGGFLTWFIYSLGKGA